MSEEKKPRRTRAQSLLPVERAGRVSPEFRRWRNMVCKPRIRRLIEELPYHVGYIEKLQLQSLIEAQFIKEALADNIIRNSRYDDSLDATETDGQNKRRNPLLLYLQYSKLVKELQASLMMTPASKQNAMITRDRNDAFALLGAARRQMLEKPAIDVKPSFDS